ncbi:MAG: hypothetical protein WCK34_00800 [Bacteroidota bacterium]
MKIIITMFVLVYTVAFASNLSAQERTFKSGSVWQVGFIKTGANMTVEYLNNLKNNWKATHDEAVKEGVILSYKILEGSSANPEDWDVMLMTEFKNLSALDGSEEKFDAISKKIIGGEDAMKKLNESRVTMRTIYGGKLLKEVVYK